MAKVSRRRSLFRKQDLSAWNFIIFLTLSFILLVVVLSAMQGVSFDVRSKAGLTCPQANLPRIEDCPGGEWKFKRDPTNPSCQTFLCESVTTPKNSTR
ncbi:hypothetical protein HYV22_00980 [Candidatus Gottesmanbacteria bacterium]|nr:hypothetical protein [Candidatus Gottesmanbacteria bacterium]